MKRTVAGSLGAVVIGGAVGAAAIFPAMTHPWTLIPAGIGIGWLLTRFSVRVSEVAIGLLSIVVLYNYAYVQQALQEPGRRTAELVANGAFLVLAAVAALVVVLIGRNKRWQTVAAIVVGLAIAQFCTMILVWIGMAQPYGTALGWYWYTMLPYGAWSWESLEEPLGRLADVTVMHPGAFTFCLGVLLTFLILKRPASQQS